MKKGVSVKRLLNWRPFGVYKTCWVVNLALVIFCSIAVITTHSLWYLAPIAAGLLTFSAVLYRANTGEQ